MHARSVRDCITHMNTDEPAGGRGDGGGGRGGEREQACGAPRCARRAKKRDRHRRRGEAGTGERRRKRASGRVSERASEVETRGSCLAPGVPLFPQTVAPNATHLKPAGRRPTYRAILKPACIPGAGRFPSLFILPTFLRPAFLPSLPPSTARSFVRSFGRCEGCCSLRRASSDACLMD
jgi:hypothetical protein